MSDIAVDTIREGATEIRLTRPERKNAITPTMWIGIREAVESAVVAGHRVVLITGGEEFFSAGSDLEQMKERTWVDAYRADAQRTILAIRAAPVLSIAAVNGVALGGACELAVACDLTLVGRSAVLGHPEVQYGFIPGAGGTQMLAERIGAGRALEMILTGRRICGDAAAEMGLATSVHDDDSVQNSARALIDTICNAPAAAVLMTVAASRAQRPSASGFLAERLAQAICFLGDERSAPPGP